MFLSKLFRKEFKLDFIIAGAQKSGTTALFSYLQNDPDVEMSQLKELHFFDNDEFFSRKKPKYNWIKKQFRKHSQAKFYGEATPIYMYWKPCIQRIHAYNPNIKIICILRNPTNRAFSQWNHEMEMKTESRDFFECIKKEQNILVANPDFQHRVNSYIGRGFYSKQITELQKYFNDKQLLFIKYEDFLKNQRKIITHILWFIGVSPKHKSFTENYEQNFKAYTRVITEDEKKYLNSVFANDIDKVEKILNWDCSDWKI